MNSSLKTKNLANDSRQRKTAVVHPYGLEKQRTQLLIKCKANNNENFSSLPADIEASQRKGVIENETEKTKPELLRKTKSNCSSLSPTKLKPNKNAKLENRQQKVRPKTIVLTKPFLDYIDELCSGADSNCDRKKLNQEQRRKSLSKDRVIGLKQFFQYSPLWRDRKHFLSHKQDLLSDIVHLCQQNCLVQCHNKFPLLGIIRLGIVHCNCNIKSSHKITKKESSTTEELWYEFLSM